MTRPALLAVAFDLMDTVVRDPYREALRAATGLPLAQLFSRRDPEAYPALERGEITEAQYWAAYEDAGVDVDTDAFHRARRDGYEWMPGMAALLDDLAGDVRRIGASNYPDWVEELAEGMLAGRIDEVHASCTLGARKPDTAFYERLLTRVGCDAEQVLFVDDREVNVQGALAVGLRAHLFVDADDLRRRLRAEGISC